MPQTPEASRVTDRIVITDDLIDWDLRVGTWLWENAEDAIAKGLYYMYGNSCLFDLHELRWDFRNVDPDQGHIIYNYAIYADEKGWLHPAYDYQGEKLNG